MEEKRVEIRTSTILRTLGLIVGLIFLWFIKDILVIVFFALIIASAVNPLVRRLQKFHIPRPFGVLIVYVLGASILLASVTVVFTPLAQELTRLSQVIPQITEAFQGLQQFPQLGTELQSFLLNLSNRISGISINLFSITGNVLNVMTSLVAVFVISFYLAVEDQGIRDFLYDITPKHKKDFVVNLWENTQKRLGTWFKAELLLGMSVGLLIFIGLSLLNIQYAIVLGLLAALFEFIPYVGPILAAIPAVLIAFIKGPVFALLALALYILTQQVENYILAPQIMKRVVALNPIVVIIVLLIGYKMGGFIGVILAVPVTVFAIEISKEVFGLEGVKLWKTNEEIRKHT